MKKKKLTADQLVSMVARIGPLDLNKMMRDFVKVPAKGYRTSKRAREKYKVT